MHLRNSYCSVHIELADSYIIGSPSNEPFDITLNLDEYESSDFYKVLRIVVDLHDREYTVALIGDGQCSDEDCAVLEGSTLTVLQGWQIVQLDMLAGKLIRTVKLNNMGCNFAIYKIKENYLIYGEIDITMLDSSFRKMWSFSGRDIFVSITSKKAFEVRENKICLYDFEDNYYELGLDGTLFVDVPNS